jgi:putative ABC transport system substrate-binding protein
MRRRDFLSLSGFAAVWSLGAAAQQPTRLMVGYLGLAPASSNASRLEALRSGLREFGYVENQNFFFEPRWAAKPDQLAELAKELVQLRPSVIVTSGNAASLAVKSQTSDIPILFSVADDPVRLGLVASFSHPGGNVTGVSLISGSLGAKRIELLRDLKPDVRQIAMLINPTNPAEANARDEQSKAEQSGLKLLVLHAATEVEIDNAFGQAAEQKAGAILVNADALFTSHRERITALAARYKLAGMYAWREFTDDGGLMSYGVSLADAYRQNGIYIGKVLRGVKPADLPVTQPTRIELTINLKTARMLGLEIPVKLLALADAVIE